MKSLFLAVAVTFLVGCTGPKPTGPYGPPTEPVNGLRYRVSGSGVFTYYLSNGASQAVTFNNPALTIGPLPFDPGDSWQICFTGTMKWTQIFHDGNLLYQKADPSNECLSGTVPNP